MQEIELDYQTLLGASIVLKGRQLRDLLDGLTTGEFTELVNRNCNVIVPNTPFFKEELTKELTTIRAARGILLSAVTTILANRFLQDENMCASEYATSVLAADFQARLNEYWEVEYPDTTAVITRIAPLSENECQQILRAANIETEDDLDSLNEDELHEVLITNYFAGAIKPEAILTT